MPRTRSLLLAVLVLSPLIAWSSAGCAPASPASAQAAPLQGARAACFLRAHETTNLTDAQAERLCLGAPTPYGPIACFASSRQRLRLTDDQSVFLCRCASSEAPVDCFRRIDEESALTDAQILALCASTVADGWIGCAPWT